jgi:predicted AlkP superfamily phosphohydrolase/phosphomutase
LLWPLAALGLTFTLFNSAVLRSTVPESWKLGGRGALALLAISVLVHAFWHRAGAPSSTFRRLERGLALMLLPALLAAVVGWRGEPLATAEVGEGDLIALAPRFAPEPPEVYPGIGEAERLRVILLGIDGASWERIDAGIAAGRLPTFARLRDRGVHAPLETLFPTYSPAIWTSMVTGVGPSEHGIRDFYLTQLPQLGVENFRLRPGFSAARRVLAALDELRYVPVTSSLRRRKALWNLADEAGLRSAVLGLWATWPPEPLQHGVVVSDHASLAKRYEWADREKTSRLTVGVTTSPADLAQRLARFQRSPESVTREELSQFLAVDDDLWREFRGVRRFSKQVRLSAFRSSHLNDAYYAEAAQLLWREQRPHLMVVYLRAVDELSHFFYEAGVPEARELGYSKQEIARYGAVVDSAYRWTDRAIAPLVEAVERDGRTLLVVVSDHGWEKESDGGYDHNHAPPGILILYGAGVCRSSCPSLASPSIYDVAPTILARLALPISEELVGRSLDEAFERPARTRHVAQYGGRLNRARSVASGLDQQLTNKLEALGYLR